MSRPILRSAARTAFLALLTSGLGCATPVGDSTGANSAPHTPSSADDLAAGVGEGGGSASGTESTPGAAPATIELELRQLSSNHIVVPLRIGDRAPVSFILDTGASTSVISRKTQDSVGLRDEDGTPVKGQGAHGKLDDVRMFSLDSVSVGARRYGGLDVAVMDLAHLESSLDEEIGGILGRNFLARHDVEIDFGARRLALHAPGSIARGQLNVSEMSRLPITALLGGLIGIQVSLDESAPFTAVLDLGAGRSVINWRAAKAAGLSRRDKSLKRGKEALLGAGNEPIETHVYTFAQVVASEARFEAPELAIADLGVFATLGLAGAPAMVFGLDFLKGRAIIIDYGASHVFITNKEVS